jgi:hypothetical protein
MAEVKDRWVVCDEYVRGPFTKARAEQVAAQPLAGKWACELEHRVVQAERKPEPAWRARLEP